MPFPMLHEFLSERFSPAELARLKRHPSFIMALDDAKFGRRSFEEIGQLGMSLLAPSGETPSQNHPAVGARSAKEVKGVGVRLRPSGA